MNTDTTRMQKQNPFAASTREAIRNAQREAVRMDATEVYPEHLFLGAINQDSAGVAEVLNTLGMNSEAIRTQVATVFILQNENEEGERSVPLSKAAQDCVDWAISFTTQTHAMSVLPEHVLLSSLRNQRLQPLLALLLSQAGITLPSYLMDNPGPAYTTAMDQLIYSRVRIGGVVSSSDAVSSRTLSSFGRPFVTFADILGFRGVKQELRAVIDFLKRPQIAINSLQAYLYGGLLLVGPAGNSRTLIVQAIAGEAVVPLVRLSIPALIELASSITSTDMGPLDADLSSRQYAEVASKEIIQRGRNIIHDIFDRGKNASPCLVFIDDLDALDKPDMKEACGQWQKQLAVEMDGRDYHPPIAVVATTSRADKIDSSLLQPGRFGHSATLDGTATRFFEAGLTLCPACQQEVPADWKYCAFCGTALARTCPQCGAMRPEVKGVHFCPQCGSNLDAVQEKGELT